MPVIISHNIMCCISAFASIYKHRYNNSVHCTYMHIFAMNKTLAQLYHNFNYTIVYFLHESFVQDRYTYEYILPSL